MSGELSEWGTIVVGAMGGIAEALTPTPTGATAVAQMRPDVQPTLGVPTEYLMLGGLALAAVVAIVLLSR